MTSIETIIDAHRHRDGPLLPILHDVQAAQGHIGETAIRTIAAALNLTRAEVHGVVSFYHDFTTAPDDRPCLKLCRAEACQARGSEPLAEAAKDMAGDRVRIEAVYCLGLCSSGPAAMTGTDVHARLDEDRMRKLIGALG